MEEWKLYVDEHVPPLAQAMSRILLSRREKVVQKLDVIEKVNGPTSWINPLLAVEKPDGDVRIYLVGEVFSKLDLNMGFHQMQLTLESRDITTFSVPNGL